MDVIMLLYAILLCNILQIPQAQKAISWLWVEFKFRRMKAFSFISKWSRRAYYGVMG